MTGSASPAAILDVDGVLVEGSLGIEFTEYVFKDAYPFGNGIADVAYDFLERRARDEEPNYRTMAAEVIYHWVQGTIGYEKEWMTQQAAAFVAEYDRMLDDVPRLMDILAACGYDIYLVSLNPEEALKPFAEEIASSDVTIDVYGTKLRVDDTGRYTGKLQRNMMKDGKTAVLDDIFTASVQQRSIAIGDEETDIPLLAAVEYPIALSEELEETAQQRGWLWYEDLSALVEELDRFFEPV